MNQFPSELFAFGITVQLIWEKIPIADNQKPSHQCGPDQFYLNIPGVARFLALAKEQRIVIEPAHEACGMELLNTWLQGTMMAYLLQYHGYMVLHGSSVRLHKGNAVIISGQSGAGKSTLATALVRKGHSFITDDLVVIKVNQQGHYCIVPGPAKLKLWNDAMQHFDYLSEKALPIFFKRGKYAVSVQESCQETIPIAAFYELKINQKATTAHWQQVYAKDALKILMQNAYRYFMLPPLGKLPNFLSDCSGLLQQITVYQITRPVQFNELARITEKIESDLSVTQHPISKECTSTNES